jgi:hypothetical protein
MKPRYFGPMIVISRNKGGAYIICDLDGTLLHAPVAAFRLVPYLARNKIDIPDIEDHIDVDTRGIWLCARKQARRPSRAGRSSDKIA